MRWRNLAFVLSVWTVSSAMAGPLEDGLEAANRGDFATALSLWRPLADQGNADAQYNLGRLYEQCSGGAHSFAEAMSWYRKAADQGNAPARAKLDEMKRRAEAAAAEEVRQAELRQQELRRQAEAEAMRKAEAEKAAVSKENQKGIMSDELDRKYRNYADDSDPGTARRVAEEMVRREAEAQRQRADAQRQGEAAAAAVERALELRACDEINASICHVAEGLSFGTMV